MTLPRTRHGLCRACQRKAFHEVQEDGKSTICPFCGAENAQQFLHEKFRTLKGDVRR